MLALYIFLAICAILVIAGCIKLYVDDPCTETIKDIAKVFGFVIGLILLVFLIIQGLKLLISIMPYLILIAIIVTLFRLIF